MKIDVRPMRSKLEDTADGIQISIPATRGWKFIWMTFWAIVFLFTGGDWYLDAVKKTATNDAFMRYWLFFVSVAVILSHIHEWAWVLGGRMIIEIDREALKTRREYFGFGLTHKYQLSDVHDLHYAPPEKKGKSRIPQGLAFNYRGKLRRINTDLDEAEANQLLGAIQQRTQVLGFGARHASAS